MRLSFCVATIFASASALTMLSLGLEKTMICLSTILRTRTLQWGRRNEFGYIILHALFKAEATLTSAEEKMVGNT